MIFKWLNKKADESNWWQLFLIIITLVIGAFIFLIFLDGYDWIMGKFFGFI